jgi:protein gp37
MAETSIEWTDATWNPVAGCAIVSPGCTNCYAMKLAGTRHRHLPSRSGLTRQTKAGPVWTGEVRFNAPTLEQPLHWRRARKIFVCAHGDLFAEGVPDEWIDRVFAVMGLCPQHVFQVLTKRPERMRAYLKSFGQRLGEIMAARVPHPTGEAPLWDLLDAAAFCRPLPNVWLGVSVEDQKRADERIPVLLDTPAAVRWISAEPLLGPVNIGPWIPTCYECGASCGLRLSGMPDVERCTECGEACGPDTEPVVSEGCPKCAGELEPVCPDCGHYMVYQHPDTPNLDWVVVGGESGSGARPMHPDWARCLRDQCAAADVPFHFKQWGAWREAAEGDVFDTSKGRSARPPAFIVSPADGTVHCFLPKNPDPRLRVMLEVGKKAAGRLLDGVTHDGFPQVAA